MKTAQKTLIAAALAAGNTVISKPSEHTPILAFEVINLFLDQGLPEDAIHLFLGDGDIAQAIILNQPIDLVAFTGSLKTAKMIHQSLSSKAGKIIPLIAETGGLNSMIVDSSALLERACDDIIRSAFNSAGQRCSALRLLLIHQEIYPQLISMLVLTLLNDAKTKKDISPNFCGLLRKPQLYQFLKNYLNHFIFFKVQ